MADEQRTLFPWPAWANASPEVVALVRSGEAHLIGAPPGMERQGREWLDGGPFGEDALNRLGSVLRHPLAPWFAARAEPFSPEVRSLKESSVLDRFGARLLASIRAEDTGDFVRGLATLASHGLGRRVSPRWGRVGTDRDAMGARVVFPPSSLIPGRMAHIHHRLRASQAPALYDGVVAMAAISNCHPFADGNGRTSRMLFNALIRRGFDRPQIYVPLHELATLSGGSLTLAAREAELHGRWEPLVQFVERSLFLMASGALSSAISSRAALTPATDDAPIATAQIPLASR